MNKSELSALHAQRQGITKVAAAEQVQAVVTLMQDAVSAGKLELAGFGNFSHVKKPARAGRNPRTGEPMDIAAKVVVKFSPASSIRNAVSLLA